MEFIKDKDCTQDTPLVFGAEYAPIYGTGQRIAPRLDGKHATEYEKRTYLPELLPLEEYDLIVVLFSGGKDSLAAYLRLLEMGVPKDKIELWHHDIDGGHPDRRMDWPVTQAYIRAFAQAEGVKLRVSWREKGFFGELYRVGASYPVGYEDDRASVMCPLSQKQKRSEELRRLIKKGDLEAEAELVQYGQRLRFPAKSGDLRRRWCSAYLKIDVADTVICNLDKTKRDTKILVVSGERRGESAGRAGYNEIEVHRKNATAKAGRLVHQWRVVIDHTLRDVWEVIRRHNVRPHPCYTAGWNRCSCMACIFSLPHHWAGIRELFPAEYEAIKADEERLGFTLDNKKSLDEYTGDAESCVDHSDEKAIQQIKTGTFDAADVFVQPGAWAFPSGAFKGSDGGPC